MTAYEARARESVVGVLMMVRVLSAHCPECGAVYLGLWNIAGKWGFEGLTADFPVTVAAERIRNSSPCDRCKGRVLYDTEPVE